MAARKGLSKIFTKEVVSEEALSPSDFKVVPIKPPNTYEDSPIEDIRRYKRTEENFNSNEKPKSAPKKVKFTKEIIIDHEKINRIAQRLNSLKKIQSEKEKQEREIEAKTSSPIPQPAPASKPVFKREATSEKQGIMPVKKTPFFGGAGAKKPGQKSGDIQKDIGGSQGLLEKKQNISTAQTQEKKETSAPTTGQSNVPKKQEPLKKEKKEATVKEPSF